MKKSCDSNERNITSNGRIALIIALLLAIIGLGVSIELTQIHYYTHTDPTYSSLCAVNDRINCETVAQSPYSVFMGIPISVWGILGYLFTGLFCLWGLLRKKPSDTWPRGIVFGLSLASLLVSAALGYISVARIDSLCIFCTSLYAINTGAFITASILLAKTRTGPLKALGADLTILLSKPLLTGALILTAAASVGALYLFIPQYWQHPGWVELPSLPSGEDAHGCHWIGAEQPLVTITEFSDYECPYCRHAHKKMRLKAAEFPDKVRLIHHHLPLDQACNEDIKRPFHGRACEFSKAAECASREDKFWEMNDALFSTQETVASKDVDVERLAVQLGLDRIRVQGVHGGAGYPRLHTGRYGKSAPFAGAGHPDLCHSLPGLSRGNPRGSHRGAPRTRSE